MTTRTATDLLQGHTVAQLKDLYASMLGVVERHGKVSDPDLMASFAEALKLARIDPKSIIPASLPTRTES